MDCVNSFNLDQFRHLDQLFGLLGALLLDPLGSSHSSSIYVTPSASSSSSSYVCNT